jgi:hypothetical protein
MSDADSVIPSLAQVTAAELQAGSLGAVLPEIYALENTVENSGGHQNQNVLVHTIGVMAGMEKVIQAEFLPVSEREVLRAYLQQKVTTHTYLELLRLAILTHDVMKPAVLLTDAHGMTICPAHEILAVAKIPSFQARFGLDTAEVKRVQDSVRVHDFPHSLLTVGLAKPTTEPDLFAQFCLAVGEVALEVVVLVYADILGGDLAKVNPSDFAAREQLCQTWLDRLVRSA